MDTVQALGVTLVAVLPGATYTFALERWTGAFGVTLSDRLIRFSAASAAFVAMFAGPAFLMYRDFVATGRLASGDISPFLVEIVALAYVGIPFGAGTLVGFGKRNRWGWTRWVVGEAPEPRAWDYLWRHGTQGVVRAKLLSGVWLAGLYGTTADGRQSYAAGYPEEQDLYLAVQFQVDAATGAFERDSDGRPCIVEGRTSLLIRWDQIEFIEYMEVDRA